VARRKKSWVVRRKDGLELGEFGTAVVEEKNACGVEPIRFHRQIGHREEEKNPAVCKRSED